MSLAALLEPNSASTTFASKKRSMRKSMALSFPSSLHLNVPPAPPSLSTASSNSSLRSTTDSKGGFSVNFTTNSNVPPAGYESWFVLPEDPDQKIAQAGTRPENIADENQAPRSPRKLQRKRSFMSFSKKSTTDQEKPTETGVENTLSRSRKRASAIIMSALTLKRRSRSQEGLSDQKKEQERERKPGLLVRVRSKARLRPRSRRGDSSSEDDLPLGAVSASAINQGPVEMVQEVLHTQHSYADLIVSVSQLDTIYECRDEEDVLEEDYERERVGQRVQMGLSMSTSRLGLRRLNSTYSVGDRDLHSLYSPRSPLSPNITEEPIYSPFAATTPSFQMSMASTPTLSSMTTKPSSMLSPKPSLKRRRSTIEKENVVPAGCAELSQAVPLMPRRRKSTRTTSRGSVSDEMKRNDSGRGSPNVDGDGTIGDVWSPTTTAWPTDSQPRTSFFKIETAEELDAMLAELRPVTLEAAA